MTVLRGTGLGEPARRGNPGGARARGAARVPQAAAMVCGQGPASWSRCGSSRPSTRRASPRGRCSSWSRRDTATASPTPISCRRDWPAAPRPSGWPARRPAGSSRGSMALGAIDCSMTAWPIPRSARPLLDAIAEQRDHAGRIGRDPRDPHARSSARRGPVRGAAGGHPRQGRAEQHGRDVRPSPDPQGLPAGRAGDQSRLRDRAVPGRADAVRPRADRRRRAGVPPAQVRADLAGDPAGARPQPGQWLGACAARAAGPTTSGPPDGSRRPSWRPILDPTSSWPIGSRRRRSGT